MATHRDTQPVLEHEVTKLSPQRSVVRDRKVIRPRHRQKHDIELLALEGIHRTDPNALLEVAIHSSCLTPSIGDAERSVWQLFGYAERFQLRKDSIDLTRVEGDNPEAEIRSHSRQRLELFGYPASLRGPALALPALLLPCRQRDVDPSCYVRLVAWQGMFELIGRRLGPEGLPMGRIEGIADETPKHRVHPVLHVKRNCPLDAVDRFSLAHRLEQALKETSTQCQQLRMAVRDGRASGPLNGRKKGLNAEITDLQSRIGFLTSLEADLAAGVAIVQSLLACPTCASVADPRRDFKGGPGHRFSCECPDCSTQWGAEACPSCTAWIPTLLPAVTSWTVNEAEVGWLDRFLGADSLAVPYKSERGGLGHVCPSCGHGRANTA